jgi:hypothetical protein
VAKEMTEKRLAVLEEQVARLFSLLRELQARVKKLDGVEERYE